VVDAPFVETEVISLFCILAKMEKAALV